MTRIIVASDTGETVEILVRPPVSTPDQPRKATRVIETTGTLLRDETCPVVQLRRVG